MKSSIPIRSLLVLLLTLSNTITSYGADLNAQRTLFLQAEQYLKNKDTEGFNALAPEIADYALYPHLLYLSLKDRLQETERINDFISRYDGTRFAEELRGNWLDYLSGQNRWNEFIRHYRVNEDSQDDCRYQWARYQTGSQQAALAEAKRLWLTGKLAEKFCSPLFAAFENSSGLTAEMAWQRFETTIKNNKVGAARAALPHLKSADRKQAETWLLLHEKPALVENNRYWQDKGPQNGRLFAHALGRLKGKDIERAMRIWETKSAEFEIDSQSRSDLESRFGLALLNNRDNRAYSHLAKATLADEETRAARVRAALLEQNWQHVENAVANLTPEEKSQAEWQYWNARALAQNGKKQLADVAFKTLAEDRSYYGFLAADAVKTPYKLNDKPLQPSKTELDALADIPDIKAAREFKILGRDLDTRRHWQYAIKHLPPEKIRTAAKLAEQWGWDQLAITTLVKSGYWDDVGLRFPLRYLGEVNRGANENNLDSALIYGLIRQESMLDATAVSSVGAMGLMQLMPATAQTVARQLDEKWQSRNDLFNPDLNIRLGSRYFSSLLNQFNRHPAVASAAYNAGPGRAIKWLPAVSPVAADIWIETIPFKETRKYVSSVLAYAIIYQERLKKKTLRLANLLADITPQKN